MNMNVNGVTSNTPVYGATSAASANTTSEQKVTTDATTKPNDTGVVYEKSDAFRLSWIKPLPFRFILQKKRNYFQKDL